MVNEHLGLSVPATKDLIAFSNSFMEDIPTQQMQNSPVKESDPNKAVGIRTTGHMI